MSIIELEKKLKIAKKNNIYTSGLFIGESYDAAALIMLAIQAGNSADRSSIAQNVMGVANAPGTEIFPGELGKALEILKDGGEVNYQGATNVEFSDVGEASGSYKELEIGNGEFNTIQVR